MLHPLHSLSRPASSGGESEYMPRRPETPAERRQKVMARVWLGTAVAVVIGYAWWFGYYPGGDWILDGEDGDEEL